MRKRSLKGIAAASIATITGILFVSPGNYGAVELTRLNPDSNDFAPLYQLRNNSTKVVSYTSMGFLLWGEPFEGVEREIEGRTTYEPRPIGCGNGISTVYLLPGFSVTFRARAPSDNEEIAVHLSKGLLSPSTEIVVASGPN